MCVCYLKIIKNFSLSCRQLILQIDAVLRQIVQIGTSGRLLPHICFLHLGALLHALALNLVWIPALLLMSGWVVNRSVLFTDEVRRGRTTPLRTRHGRQVQLTDNSGSSSLRSLGSGGPPRTLLLLFLKVAEFAREEIVARSGRLLSTVLKVLLVRGVEGGAAAQSVGFWWGSEVGFKRVGWLDELDVTSVAKVAHDVTALAGVNIAWIIGPWPWHITTSPCSILKAVLGRRPIGSSRIPTHTHITLNLSVIQWKLTGRWKGSIFQICWFRQPERKCQVRERPLWSWCFRVLYTKQMRRIVSDYRWNRFENKSMYVWVWGVFVYLENFLSVWGN